MEYFQPPDTWPPYKLSKSKGEFFLLIAILHPQSMSQWFSDAFIIHMLILSISSESASTANTQNCPLVTTLYDLLGHKFGKLFDHLMI